MEELRFFSFSRYQEPSMSFSPFSFLLPLLSRSVSFTFSRSFSRFLASSNIVVKSQRLVTRTQGTWLTHHTYFYSFFFHVFFFFLFSFFLLNLFRLVACLGIARCWDSSRKTLRARDTCGLSHRLQSRGSWLDSLPLSYLLLLITNCLEFENIDIFNSNAKCVSFVLRE